MTYSSTLALQRKSSFAARGQNAITFRTRDRSLGPITTTITLILLACVLGLLYLTQVTKTNAYGYKVNDLMQQQQKLKTEHDELVVASARLQSVERVQNSDVAKSLVSVAPSATAR